MNRWTPKTTLIVAGAAVLGVWYLKTRAVATAKEVGQAVNPVNQENIFNRGFEAVYGAVTDGQGSPGTDLADWVHSDQRWWN